MKPTTTPWFFGGPCSSIRQSEGCILEDVKPWRILLGQIEQIARGAISLLPNLVAALLVLVVTAVIVRIFRSVFARTLRRTKMRSSLQSALLTVFRIALWVAGVVIASAVLFPNLTPTKVLAGLGIGSLAVGLAFKDIFENFLAGILILVREPMRIGDDIECEDVSGRVEKITVRDTYLRKRSGELILVPNSYLFQNPIRVLTDQRLRRIELVVGVAYGEDVDTARDVIRSAFDGLDTVDGQKGVDVLAREFNSSSVDFLVRWWAGSTPREEHVSRDLVTAAIKRALDTAGIEIPFPYRTLTFKEPLELGRNSGSESN